MALERLVRLHRAGAQHAETLQLAVEEVLYGGGCDADAADTDEGERQLELQGRLYAALFEDEVARRCPPPRAGRQRLMKCLLKELDSGKLLELDDNLYSACIEGMHGGTDVSDSTSSFGLAFDGYRTLEVPGAGSVALRVTTHMGGAAETGCLLWTAGCALFGLLASGACDELAAGHVLELGAGTGAVGLALARRGAAVRRVTLTDGMPAVVENLRHNAAATSDLLPLAVPVEVQKLDWVEGVPGWLSADPPDVIIGSDLVYDLGSIAPLSALLRRLLRPHGTVRLALLALAHRSEETYNSFLEAVAKESLFCDELTFPEGTWETVVEWASLAHDFTAVQAALDETSPGALPGVHVLRIAAAD